jgi:O-acetylserine/cysteine efflux transporter
MAAAWLLRNEAVEPQRAIAAALIVAGMACTVIRPRTQRKADSPELMLSNPAS